MGRDCSPRDPALIKRIDLTLEAEVVITYQPDVQDRLGKVANEPVDGDRTPVLIRGIIATLRGPKFHKVVTEVLNEDGSRSWEVE